MEMEWRTVVKLLGSMFMNTIARDEVDVVPENYKHKGPYREQVICDLRCLYSPQQVYDNRVRDSIENAKRWFS